MARLLQDKSPEHIYWKNLDRGTKIFFNKERDAFYTEKGQLVYWFKNESLVAKCYLKTKV